MKTHARPFRRASLALAAFVLVSGGCATQVTRVSPEQQIDLSGRWNDADSRLVAEELIRLSFDTQQGGDWAVRHMQAHAGARPTVIIGSVRNRSMEQIPVGTFVRDLEQAYLRSGQVAVVASRDEREEVREEKLDQQENATADTRARLARERGADYMLQGDIQSIEDREGRRRVVYYQVDLVLVNVETNEKTWTGQHKIKKMVERPRFRI
ncbi:MAG TPA: penicillin-binding protein activator LpoB [Longimicrobium sp.]|nr:penicillin-binding protein activator LpoB [Longimicrobium sp.]